MEERTRIPSHQSPGQAEGLAAGVLADACGDALFEINGDEATRDCCDSAPSVTS